MDSTADLSISSFFRLPKCGKSNIRVLIFRECDRKGKSLLFDSDAVVEAKEEQVRAFHIGQLKSSAWSSGAQNEGRGF